MDRRKPPLGTAARTCRFLLGLRRLRRLATTFLGLEYKGRPPYRRIRIGGRLNRRTAAKLAISYTWLRRLLLGANKNEGLRCGASAAVLPQTDVSCIPPPL